MTDDGSTSTKNLVEFLPPLSEIRGGVYGPGLGARAASSGNASLIAHIFLFSTFSIFLFRLLILEVT